MLSLVLFSGLTMSQVCNETTSGAAVISSNTFGYGQFEFMINPAMPAGMVTAFGLAYDGTSYNMPPGQF